MGLVVPLSESARTSLFVVICSLASSVCLEGAAGAGTPQREGIVIRTMNDTAIGTGLVVMGGTPVLNVGVVTALQTDPRIRLLPHTLDAAGAAVPLGDRAFDVLALLTDAPMPDALREWERLDPD